MDKQKLHSKWQALEEAVAELDNIIRKDCKIDSASMNPCRAIRVEKEVRAARELSYANICLTLSYLLYSMELRGLGLWH